MQCSVRQPCFPSSTACSSLACRALPPQRDPPRLAQAYNMLQLPLAAAAKKHVPPVVAAEPAHAKGGDAMSSAEMS